MKFFTIVILLFSLGVGVYAQDRSLPYLLDMVHHNPGEELTKSAFNKPGYVKQQGYNGIVINDFTFAHTALTFDSFDKRIFPPGTAGREWVLKNAEKVRKNIAEAHKAGLKVYYFTDIIVLPKKLVELYHDEICDKNGKISFERPKTIEIHQYMFSELFRSFPGLDGLVIRTGETYLNNVPYHIGNNPITNAVSSHVKLLKILREEVCVKLNKKVFYRTWSFGGMHDNSAYYLAVTDSIKPSKNLIFSIKHTQGDYHRTFNFNPTLGIGKHKQIVEVQCQREYEGKGAYPNYIAKGVIEGFEEYDSLYPQFGNKGLNDLKNLPQFDGIWTWSRGGGWVGPYLKNEFWCKLNANILSEWANKPAKKEEEIFQDWMIKNGVDASSRDKFRELCLLSSQAVLRMHESAKYKFDKEWVWWTRDQFLGGIEKGEPLEMAFNSWYQQHHLMPAVVEKYHTVEIWKNIARLSREITLKNKADKDYLQVSSQYGLLLSEIIAEGWNVMALGFTGDQTGSYDLKNIQHSIVKYDAYWKKYSALKKSNPSCATLYVPFAFEYVAPTYQAKIGMDFSINKYRTLEGRTQK